MTLHPSPSSSGVAVAVLPTLPNMGGRLACLDMMLLAHPSVPHTPLGPRRNEGPDDVLK